jgi:aryl-alcohol dehydrogenase (NADP+)
MQNHYNLLYREEEREMLPFCLDQGIGVIPWSPLARGFLAREWGAESNRTQKDPFGRSLYGSDDDRAVAEEVGRLAAERGVSRAQVALAWLRQRPAVTAPIVGTTRIEQLTDAIASLDLTLTSDEIARLEKPYTPHPVAGF